jgi:membrane dipeptidase
MKETLVWDCHGCMPLRPGDTSFLPGLERVRNAGVNHLSLNVGFDLSSGADVLQMLATFRHWILHNSDRFVLVESVTDIELAKSSGQLAITFDLEGGNAIASPGMIEVLYRLGVRWMLLAYNRNNALGGGCMDEDCGLTTYGRRIIDEMEAAGMLLCCSHSGHRTALEAIEHSRNPVIFSHSNARAVHPHPRNIGDDLIRACAKSGGVVNLNGVGIFLGQRADGSGDNSTAALLRHIDYCAELVGPKHVGIGLDYLFDPSELDALVSQSPTIFPAELQRGKDYVQVEPERFPIIAEGLLAMGYGDDDVQGVLGHNNLRVARQVWK